MRKSWPSIQRRILTSITVVLLVQTVALTGLFGFLIYRRIEANLNERLGDALKIAWQEYLDRPRHTLAAMRYLVPLTDSGRALAYGDGQRLRDFLVRLPNVDFATFLSPSGEVLAHTAAGQAGAYSPLAKFAFNAIQLGTPQISSEELDQATLLKQAPGLAGRFGAAGGDPPFAKALVQVIVLPVEWQGQTRGALVAGIVLNDTAHIPQSYTAKMPNSYLSIAVEGVRVSSNIKTKSGEIRVGSHQSNDLIDIVSHGRRWYGTVQVGSERHYVVSDPIRDSAGQVIGALSLGLPPSGFANLQREWLLVVLTCAFLSFLLAAAVATFVAGSFSQPIVWLNGLAQRLARFQGERDYQRALDECLRRTPPLFSQEMTELYHSFAFMAHELVCRYGETVQYLQQLERDREELQGLAAQLQEAKELLEQKVAERTRELQQAVAELQKASALKSQFLATMSHELRSPLNSVIGFAEMMEDELVGPLTAKQKDYLGNILTSARHLLALINDMLDLSRIEQGRMVLNLQAVVLADVAVAAQTMFSRQAEEAGLTLQVDVPSDLPLLWADPIRLKEVLCNLISNAIKFTPQGSIWVRAWAEAGEVVVEVEDTGIGIKPDDQEVIFNEFVQAESAYHRRFEGAGLGLPLSKKLVELHGGRITLESELGKGTRVRVSLPCNGQPAGGMERAG
ncbi:MAG: ATP-binding protein [Betaproteobacteria bacterium]